MPCDEPCGLCNDQGVVTWLNASTISQPESVFSAIATHHSTSAQVISFSRD